MPLYDINNSGIIDKFTKGLYFNDLYENSNQNTPELQVDYRRN